MLLRIGLFLMMAIGLLGLGAVAWTSVRPHGSPVAAEAAVRAAPPPRSVLVAAASLRPGDLIKPENVVAKELPGDVADAVLDSPEARTTFVGAMLKRAIGKDEPLHAADVMRPSEHGFLAAVVGQGMSAVTIGVDAISGTAGLISPGDRVDVILTGSNDDPSIPLGRRISAETVLSNVRVVAIDQQIVQGESTRANDNDRSHTVTLETTADAAQRLSVASRIGKLSLTVRSADAPGVATRTASTPIFASDVSHALAEATPRPTVTNTLRVFPGTGDTREFRY